MTKIVYFISPTSIIKIGSKAAEFISVLGPTLEYGKKAKKLTQLSDPVSASSLGIGMMFNYCFGKGGKLTAECIVWVVCSAVGGVTCNPVLITLGTQMENVVINEILD